MSRAVPRFKRINPPLPPVGNNNGVVVYRIHGSIEGQITINTFMFSSPINAPTQTQLTTLLGNIHTGMFAKYVACISADWTTSYEDVQVVHRNDILGVQSTTSAGTAGGRPAGHLPTEVAITFLRQTAIKGQHGRGRFSLPAVSSGDVTASKVTLAAELTALNTLALQLVAGYTDGVNNYTPCIGQRATSPPRLVIGFAPVVNVLFSALLGTVRRRKIGRGK